MCFNLVVLKEYVDLPNCYLGIDVNRFIQLVSQWKEVKNTIFNRTKELIIRGMGLLVLCTSIDEAEQILEAIFIIILSKFDGEVLQTHPESIENRKTPCAQNKDFLAKSISCNINQLDLLELSTTEFLNSEQENDVHFQDSEFCTLLDNFKHWAQLIADRAREKVENIVGVVDNAQYLPTLELRIVKTMKLFPCWSGIMRKEFGFGSETAFSSRSESNFNHLKNSVFKNENMPLRVEHFFRENFIVL